MAEHREPPCLGIRQAELRKVRVPVPSLDEQKLGVHPLGALDDRIDNLRQTNATLEAIAQALFKSWFVDFDPVRAKAEGREPEGMDAATAALFPSEFEESELGLIPKGLVDPRSRRREPPSLGAGHTRAPSWLIRTQRS
jgi:type I restriction enzyme S subunit